MVVPSLDMWGGGDYILGTAEKKSKGCCKIKLVGHEAVARRGAAEAACGKCYCVQYSVHLATWHEEIRRWTGSFLIGVVLLQNPVLRTMWRPLQRTKKKRNISQARWRPLFFITTYVAA